MASILWEPTKEQIKSSQINQFISYVNSRFDIKIENYNNLYQWSIDKPKNFWSSFWDFAQIIYHSPYDLIVDDINKMPGANWFQGTKLNFAENLLKYKDDKIAIQFVDEDGHQSSFTYLELYNNVSRLEQAMRKLGINKNDRVAGFLPNIPEAVIAMLATASIGAIWSSCSPDFGIKGVLDRFSQIKPKLIFSSSSYKYNGKTINCISKIDWLRKPS